MILRYGVWVAMTVVFLVWEATAFFVRRGSWTHPTLSHLIKVFEGIDPVTGKPVVTPAGVARRGIIAAVLVVLLLHWVFQVF